MTEMSENKGEDEFARSCLRKARFLELVVEAGAKAGVSKHVTVGQVLTEETLERLAAKAGLTYLDRHTSHCKSYEEWLSAASQLKTACQ